MSDYFFLSQEQARAIAKKWGTPVYVYDQKALEAKAKAALEFPNAFGLTVRYAMKAAPNAAILRLFESLGLSIDAGSGYEAQRALLAGIAPDKICISSQEYPKDLTELYEAGVQFNACSLHQIERFGESLPGCSVGLRFNPGIGSGGSKKTNVGGPASSFGIWHECLPQVQSLIERHRLKVVRIHTHIGSGSDPEVWQRVALLSLGLVHSFPEVTVLNLGGGYKVGRMPDEVSTDLQIVGEPIRKAFQDFAQTTQRQLHLEIEPGTFLLANSGALLTTVQDIVHTGDQGFNFVKLDGGMTDILRPTLYGAQHPIAIIPEHSTQARSDYIVVGHCCESGDLITCAPDSPDVLQARSLTKAAIGDLCLIGGAGAYCSSMSAKNYNSFPEVPEVLLTKLGELCLIRRRQKLDEIVSNECEGVE